MALRRPSRPAARPPQRREPRPGRDMRGVLVLFIVANVFGLAYVQLWVGHEDGAAVPPWAAQLAGIVVGTYVMSKGSERMVAAMTRAKRKKRKKRKAGGRPRAAAGPAVAAESHAWDTRRPD